MGKTLEDLAKDPDALYTTSDSDSNGSAARGEAGLPRHGRAPKTATRSVDTGGGGQGFRNAQAKGTYLPVPPGTLPRPQRARRPRRPQAAFPSLAAAQMILNPKEYFHYHQSTGMARSQRLSCCHRPDSMCSKRLALLYGGDEDAWLNSFTLGWENYRIAVVNNEAFARGYEKLRLDTVEVPPEAYPDEKSWDEEKGCYPSVEPRLKNLVKLHPTTILLLSSATAPSHFRTWNGVTADGFLSKIQHILARLPSETADALRDRLSTTFKTHSALINFVHYPDVTAKPLDPSQPDRQLSYLQLLEIFSSGNGKGAQSTTIGLTKPEVGTGYQQGAALLSKKDGSTFAARIQAAGLAKDAADDLYQQFQELSAAVNQRVGVIVANLMRVVLLPEELEALEARHCTNGTVTGGSWENFFTATLQLNHSPIPDPPTPAPATPASPSPTSQAATPSSEASSPARASSPSTSSAGGVGPEGEGTGERAEGDKAAKPSSPSVSSDGRSHLEMTIGIRFGAPHSDHGDDLLGWTVLVDLSRLPPGSHPGCFFDLRTGTYVELEPNRRLLYFFSGIAPHVGSAPRLPPSHAISPDWTGSTRTVGVAYPPSISYLPFPPLVTDRRSLFENADIALSTPTSPPPLLADGEGVASFGGKENGAYVLVLLHSHREVWVLVRDYLNRYVEGKIPLRPSAAEMERWMRWCAASGWLREAVEEAERVDPWVNIVARMARRHRLDTLNPKALTFIRERCHPFPSPTSDTARALLLLEEQHHLALALHLPAHSLHEMGTSYLTTRGYDAKALPSGKVIHARSQQPYLAALPPLLFAPLFDLVTPFASLIHLPPDMPPLPPAPASAVHLTEKQAALLCAHHNARPASLSLAAHWALGFEQRTAQWHEDERKRRAMFVGRRGGKSAPLTARQVHVLSGGKLTETRFHLTPAASNYPFSWEGLPAEDVEPSSDEGGFHFDGNGATLPASTKGPAALPRLLARHAPPAAEPAEARPPARKGPVRTRAAAAAAAASDAQSAVLSDAAELEHMQETTEAADEPLDGPASGSEMNDPSPSPSPSRSPSHSPARSPTHSPSPSPPSRPTDRLSTCVALSTAVSVVQPAPTFDEAGNADDSGSEGDDERDQARTPSGGDVEMDHLEPDVAGPSREGKERASRTTLASVFEAVPGLVAQALQREGARAAPKRKDIVQREVAQPEDAQRGAQRAPSQGGGTEQVDDGRPVIVYTLLDQLDPPHTNTLSQYRRIVSTLLPDLLADTARVVLSSPPPVAQPPALAATPSGDPLTQLRQALEMNVGTVADSLKAMQRASTPLAELELRAQASESHARIEAAKQALGDAAVGEYIATTVWPMIESEVQAVSWEELLADTDEEGEADTGWWSRATATAARLVLHTPRERDGGFGEEEGPLPCAGTALFSLPSSDSLPLLVPITYTSYRLTRTADAFPSSVAMILLRLFLLAALPAPPIDSHPPDHFSDKDALSSAASTVAEAVSTALKRSFLCRTLLCTFDSPHLFLLPSIASLLDRPQRYSHKRSRMGRGRWGGKAHDFDTATSPAWRQALLHLGSLAELRQALSAFEGRLAPEILAEIAVHQPAGEHTLETRPPFPPLSRVAHQAAGRGQPAAARNAAMTSSDGWTWEAFVQGLATNEVGDIDVQQVRLPARLAIERQKRPSTKVSESLKKRWKAAGQGDWCADEQKFFNYYMRECAIAYGLVPDDAGAWVPGDRTSQEQHEVVRSLIRSKPDKFSPFRNHVPCRFVFDFTPATPRAQQVVSTFVLRIALAGARPSILAEISGSRPQGWGSLAEWQEWIKEPTWAARVEAGAKSGLWDTAAYGTPVGQIGWTVQKKVCVAETFFSSIDHFLSLLDAAAPPDALPSFGEALAILGSVHPPGASSRAAFPGLQGGIVRLVAMGDLVALGVVAPPSSADMQQALVEISAGGRGGLIRLGLEGAYGGNALDGLVRVLNSSFADGGAGEDFLAQCATMGISIDPIMVEHTSCKFARKELKKARDAGFYRHAPAFLNLAAPFWRRAVAEGGQVSKADVVRT
ncbi:hypothetical protein JCM10213v2_003246 [Rhodosporidiobolus nylandii]